MPISILHDMGAPARLFSYHLHTISTGINGITSVVLAQVCLGQAPTQFGGTTCVLTSPRLWTLCRVTRFSIGLFQVALRWFSALTGSQP